MKAFLICAKLFEAIESKEISSGLIHSIFDNACNVITEKGLITFLTFEKPISPMSLKLCVDDNIKFSKLKIEKDQKIYFNINQIYSNNNDFCIELTNAKLWSSSIDIIKVTENDLINNINFLEDSLLINGKFDGIGQLIALIHEDFNELNITSFNISTIDKSDLFIKERFISFLKALLEADIENIAKASKLIIGFGKGLTPSMDDFISGIMISYIYLGNYYNLNLSKIYKLNKEIISETLNKTTLISAQMLKHSAKGEANQAVIYLIEAILGKADKENVNKALVNAINFGETSGTDTVLGIYIAFKILTNSKCRGVWLNECIY